MGNLDHYDGAAHADRLSIASPVDSYCELSKIALIGNNFSDLISKAILENNRLCSKYETLRDEQLRRFNPAAIHSAWTQAIKQSFSRNGQQA